MPGLTHIKRFGNTKNFFLCRQIDFSSLLGPTCPLCGKEDCYREITPYWRHAIDFLPVFKKEPIPIARFFCQEKRRTFSLSPMQLIPYFQYRVNAVIGTLLLGIQRRQMGQKDFYGASVAVNPESLVTLWLITCWLGVVVLGLRRAHKVLRRSYNLTHTRSSHSSVAWEEAAGYFL